jgi:hypothetical protein
MKRFLLSVLTLLTLVSSAVAQQERRGVQPPVATLFDNIYMMPFITVSYNIQSGKAFPLAAHGIGYGVGCAFDLTVDGQKAGWYFDFSWQDMRAFAKQGSCFFSPLDDSVLSTVDAEHYFQYLSIETFLKLQGAKANGYFLIGTSFGFATYSATRSVGTDVAGRPIENYAFWEGTPFGRRFRFDIRGGVGVVLGQIATHKVIFEGRFGYPLTLALDNYHNACAAGVEGDWRIITLQGNLGVRF